MFMLRIEYESRLRLDFGFLDREAAEGVKQRLAAAKDGALVAVADDHGHEAMVKMAGVLAVVLTDVEAETAGAATFELGMARVRQQTQMDLAPQNFSEPPSMGTVNGGGRPGMRAPFAS